MKKYELLDKVYKSDLPSRAKQVLVYLINRANGEGTCFPSIKTIASDCSVSERTIQRTMIILFEAGFVKKDSRFREKGGQTSNLYTLQYNFKNNENDYKKESKKKEVKNEEKQDAWEEIETVSFSDNKTSDASKNDTIENELLDENQHAINNIPEATFKGEISFIHTKYHSVFKQFKSVIHNIDYKDLMLNIQCHRESDNLYPP